MTPTLEPIGWTIAEYYLLATPLLLAALVANRANRQPAQRLAVARSALLGLAGLLALAAIPTWPKASLVAASAPRRTDSAARLPVDPTVLPAVSRVNSPSPVMPSVASIESPTRVGGDSGPRQPATPRAGVSASNWPSVVGGVFLAGMTGMLGWLGLGTWQAALIQRRSRPAPAGLRDLLAAVAGVGSRRVDLLVNETLKQPLAMGTWRPTIILPARWVEAATGADLRVALAHEWAHVAHRDLWLIALLRLVMPVLYAHPAYWRLRSQIRDDQEAVADAVAARVDGRLSYAALLLAWATRLADPAPFGAGGSIALFERPSQLKWRIKLLLQPGCPVEPICPLRWRVGVRVGAVLAVLGLSLVTIRPRASGQDQPATSPAASPQLKADGTPARLLSPDGQPVAGAKIYLSNLPRWNDGTWGDATLAGTTDANGAIAYRVPADPKSPPTRDAIALADGFGPALFAVGGKEPPQDLTLVRDDVPIRGRVLNLQGEPVRGATVQVVGILWSKRGTLDDFLQVIHEKKEHYPAQSDTLEMWSGPGVPAFASIPVDAAGRFTVKGVGRERIAALMVRGPGIETCQVHAATRAMPELRYPDFLRQSSSREVVTHASDFTMIAGPDLQVSGTVTDMDSGQPLAGIPIHTATAFGNPYQPIATTTDAQGRYRLTGIPPQTHFHDSQDLLASPDEQSLYLPTIQSLRVAKVGQPLPMDIRLKRGVVVQGQVVDKATGRGVGARLSYYILADNPFLATYPKYGTVRAAMPISADAEGHFRVVVLPGRGVLAARGEGEHYRFGQGMETIPGPKPPPGPQEMYVTQPYYLVPSNYHTMLGIDPAEGTETLRCTIQVDPGRRVQGTVLSPDGQPLAGARIEGLQPYFRQWTDEPSPTADFVVEGIAPGEARDLVVVHEAQKLAAAVTIPPDPAGPITVQLQPSGAFTGRLLDRDGHPMPGVQLTSGKTDRDTAHELGSFREPVRSDADGRFRVEGLAPGRKLEFLVWVPGAPENQRYQVASGGDLVVAGGATVDLGDLKVSQP